MTEKNLRQKQQKIYNKLPFEIEELTDEEWALIAQLEGPQSLFSSRDIVKVGPKKYITASGYRDTGLNLYNFEARPSDVWLFGFPRSGTTLTQEMLWLIGNDLDFEKASKTILDHRFPIVDYHLLLNGKTLSEMATKTNLNEEVKKIFYQYETPHYKQLQATNQKRFIKCHIPISLMSPQVLNCGCKIVYCARNPKDVVVSLFHAKQWFGSKVNNLPLFWKLFQKNLITGTPWFENVKEAWDLRNEENFLFLFYEDTIKDIRGTLKKIAVFLEKQLSEKDLDKLEEHLRFENFQKNKSVNNDHFKELGMVKENDENKFIRKGKPGGWKEHFSPEVAKEADKWIQENCRNYGFNIPE